MSLKQLLGLGKFPIEEAEILRKIAEANNAKQEFVEFSSGKEKVKIHLRQMSLDNLMKGYDDYYIAH